MKHLIILATIGLISTSASAATLQCKLSTIVKGTVTQESKIVQASGDVDISITDFEKSEKIIGQIRGDTNEKNALALYIYHTEKDVMAVAGSTEPTTSVQLYIDGNRYLLSCWK